MIPTRIVTEDGRKSMSREWLRDRLAQERFPDDATPSTSEVCSWLGIVGDSWGELLKCGFPFPVSVATMKKWFLAQGWLDE